MLRRGEIYVKSDSLYEKGIVLMFADSLRFYAGALQLFGKANLPTAAIVTRSLFERLVDALYISKASRTRIKRYLDYFDINRAKLLRSIKVHVNFPKDTDMERMAKLQEITERSAALQRHYRFETWANKNHWSGLSLKSRCQAVGLLPHYDIVVHEYSSFTHSDPVSSQTTLSRLTPFGFTCDYKSRKFETTKEFEFAVSNTVKFQLLLFAIFCKVLNIDLDEAVRKGARALKATTEWKECFRKNRVLWN